MEYQVPQFIDVEDHIVGPLTLKQFIYLAGGAGICVVLVIYLPLVVGVLLALPVAGFAVALSFYKVNGKPFIDVLESATNYYRRAKLFLWKHQDAKATTTPVTTTAQAAPVTGNKLTRGKLSELAWSLDIAANRPPIERK